MKKIISNSAAETEKIGAEFAKTLNSGRVVAFYGDLGAGKTAFIRGMAKGFGLDAEVSSPTFAIVHEYGGSPLFVTSTCTGLTLGRIYIQAVF